MAIDIAYIVSHGFASRMVMQTNLLGKLVADGKKVALIAPDDKDENLKKYCDENEVKLIQFDERSGFSSENYSFKRKYFLENIKENPALWEKHVFATRYNTSKHPLRLIRPFYYWIIYSLIPFFPSIRKRFIKKEREYLNSKTAEKLLLELKPKKLVSTYPINFNEGVLLHYGNKINEIETWIHLLSWDNITSKGRFPEIADKFIAWGPIMKKEFVEFYNISENKIFECGVPHFDLHVEVSKQGECNSEVKKLGLSAEKKNLFFAMSSPRFAPGEIEIVEWLARKIEDDFFGDIQLIVRPHPQNVESQMADKSWLPRLKELNNLKRTKVSFPLLSKSNLGWSMQMDDMIGFSKLIGASSIVLNSGSTVSIDGLMHRKPIILTSFDGVKNKSYWRSAVRLIDYTHLKKMVSYNGIEVTKSYQDLEEGIGKYLLNLECNLENRKKTLEMECAEFSGNSTDKVVEVVLNN